MHEGSHGILDGMEDELDNMFGGEEQNKKKKKHKHAKTKDHAHDYEHDRNYAQDKD